jgi:hypothetical protein
MAAKRLLVFTVSLILASGLALAGQTIIQKGKIVTDVFNATTLTVNKISAHLLKGNIDASGNTMKNLADPQNNQDAATKAYVDANCGFKGLACDGVSEPSHRGSNPPNSCETKEIFRGPMKTHTEEVCEQEGYCCLKYPGSVCLKTCYRTNCSVTETFTSGLCGTKATLTKWCQEEGYSNYTYYVTDMGCMTSDSARGCKISVWNGSQWLCSNYQNFPGGYPPCVHDALYVQCHGSPYRYYRVTELGCG